MIKNYLRKVYVKLDVSDRLELALYGLRHQLQKREPIAYLLKEQTRSGSHQQIEMAMTKAPSKMSAHMRTLAQPR